MNAFAFFVLIFGVIVIAIGGSHAFIYFTFAHFFILSDWGEYLFIVALVFLPAMFIVSTLAAHYWDTVLTRIAYYVSGVWLGLVTNVTLFWVVLWWVYGAALLFGIPFPMSSLVLFTGACAVLYTGYGVWNVCTPRIVEIRVRIPGLPDAWKGKTAVQLSDMHLGLVFRERFLRSVMRKVSEARPDIIFITGDIFDGTDGDLGAHLEPLNTYTPRWGTYFITGNHEVYLGVERVKEILKKAPLRVLDDEMVLIEGMQILGVSYAKKSMRRELTHVLDQLGYDSAKPSILLYHEPEQVEEMAKKGVNLQLSGHTHRGQMIPFMLLTRLVYGAYHHGLHRMGNYTLYTSSGVGLWGPTVRTGSKSEIVVIRFE